MLGDSQTSNCISIVSPFYASHSHFSFPFSTFIQWDRAWKAPEVWSMEDTQHVAPKRASTCMSPDGEHRDWDASTGQMLDSHLLIWFSQEPISGVHLAPFTDDTQAHKQEATFQGLPVHTGQSGGPSLGLPASKTLLSLPHCWGERSEERSD